jgi:hypothetical protein
MMNDDELMRRLKNALPDNNIILKEDIIMNVINETNSADVKKSSPKNPFFGMQAILGGAGAVLIGTVAVFGVTMFQPKEDLVINLASSQIGNTGVANEDAKISLAYPYFKDTYVAGDALSTNADEDTIYQLEAISGNELISSLKKAFNVGGEEKVEYGDGWYSVSVGALNTNRELDYNGKYINISGANKDAVLYWSYSDNSYWSQSVVGGGTVSSPSNEGSMSRDDSPVSSEPSVGLEWKEPAPSNPSVMKNEVSKIMSSLGYSVSSYILNLDKDYVTATILLKGEETPVEFYFNFYEDNLVYAGGYGVKPVFKDLGVHPLLSEKASVDRLNNYGYWASAPSFVYRDLYPVMPMNDAWLKTEDVAAVEPTMPEVGEGEESSVSEVVEPGVIEPMPIMPVDPMPEPVEKTLIMDKAVKVWVMIWSADGKMYLVRGYVLTGNDYAFGVVNAVPDSIIKLPEYNEDMPIGDYSK